MAVYTKLKKHEIEAHLVQYDLGELLDFKGLLAGIDNTNYIIETTQNKFILTIFEGRIDKNDLPFFIDLKAHLAQKGICCATPMVAKNGEVVGEIKGKKSVIASFLPGRTVENADILVKHCGEVGAVLAKMHLAAADFAEMRENELGAWGLRRFLAKLEGLIDDYQLGLREEILSVLNFVEQNWRDDLPKAAIHSDLFPDNVFFDENNDLSGVIDFYFAATDLLVYDFAVIVNAWCFDEKNQFCQQKFAKMLQNYEKLRKFDENERNFFKIACVAASLRFLLTRLHDMFFTPADSLVTIKDPQEYLAKMRYFLGNTILT